MSQPAEQVSTDFPQLHHYINGEKVAGNGGRRGDIYNPSLGVKSSEVPLASKSEVEAAIAIAAEAFPGWSGTSVLQRSRVMARYVQLLYKHQHELATLVCNEHGKVIEDAMGSVLRGIEVAEFACGAPHAQKGEFSDNVATGIDIYSMRKPLGVVAGITPFNFPAMIPLWMAGMAIITGNTVVMKPSEKDPSCPLRLAELFVEAGGPPGVFNVINGDKEAVDTLLHDDRVKAVSFVGSTPIAQYVYATATANGKRCQAMGGAKNHMLILPDADLNDVANALMGAAYGSAGERCMAISVGVCVGDEVADKLIDILKPKVENLRIGSSLDTGLEMGPLVTKEHREKVINYIKMAEEEGSRLVVDGRDFVCDGHEQGYFLGGSLLDNVKPEMQSYQEEIFGPVLQIMRVGSFEEGAALASDHPYGNGTSIFTKNGAAARTYADKVEVGMVGINVPIPVPMAFHSFGGWKSSAFGDHNQYGMEALRFYTKVKTVTSRWQESGLDAEFSMPVLK
ncbi:MAG: malonate-semialdehyde dehydrogenase (acetylating)/methylmalonate-semialdehyde dehydrogenase [Planctomycetota bacterium]|jgi:malonate-semialdehyde dehydrogenase (acetylating)/methylmalonate-semialdehyde dehydrogenase